ncbi:MAG TPA: cupin domain-containing protein [Gaiellaceae bacterium]|nr:cupin domain-containing protein [Gaiellaceae bacterium]
MPAWTVVNLLEVKDSAVDFGLSPALEAHFARGDLGCEQTGLSYQRLAPGATQPFAHRHVSHEELYVVVGGSGRVVLDGEPRELRRWDVVRVSAETWRAFEAGDDGLELLAIGPVGSDELETRPA